MLNIQMIRDNKEKLQSVAEQKGIYVSIEELLVWDDKKRKLLQQIELLRQQRNKLSHAFGLIVKSKPAFDKTEAEHLKADVQQINSRLALLESELAEAEQPLQQLMMLVPNLVSADTPTGSSDADNVLLRTVGERPQFDFELKDHITLGALHDIIDIPRGVKTAGTRNYYLKGAGVLLHRAVQQLALDLLTAQGFTLLEVPLLVRSAALVHTGFFPLGESQTYHIVDEDKWLVGTSEVPLVSYYGNEIVDVSEPIKLAAVSTCFRNEIGSAGKDVQGLYRVHQFAKVEQVVICEASLERSEQLLQEITRNAEQLLSLLELPYQVMAVCTGDMSQKTYKQYDIETWMPSRQAYGETHSSSSLLDFQARRSHIRYRDAQGKLAFCHTLNNTAVASPRILIPLLENHQQEDGSIRLPAALWPYMNGLQRLVPSAYP
ncbi:serine--tRNA ligase [Paenibacillus agricola]|uniref:Serine--tRNA ligase n=1 Tax=Paenibacillus agricola TaxID=2716264 RepID=A0ABX0IXD2_9BACL|nr:serine--tRNA ligase [Paenibacillus agricola]NHN28597.1 serine--tRNA ligase [Paenibacillus agricola]